VVPTAAIGGDAAEQRGPIIDLNNATRLRATAQRQRIIVCDVVPDDIAVGRERGPRARRTSPLIR
jgi:hypothetical protein